MTRRSAVISLAVVACSAALSGPRLTAQSPAYGVGHPPTSTELKALAIEVLPDGRGLPEGSGTAEAGKLVYASRCAVCHGPTGREGPQDVLVGGQGTLKTLKPLKTVGSYWPFATTLFDYVRRAMPFDHPGTLPNDQIYSAVAYVLYLNGLVGEHEPIDRTSLPKVKMPNRDGFVADPRPDTHKKRSAGL